MKVINMNGSNISGDICEIEVTPYKKCFYQKMPLEANGRPFLNLSHRILYPTHKKESEIKDGERYSHYQIDGVVYDSIMTNDNVDKNYPFQLMDEYTQIYSKPQQLSMFDEMEEEDEEE